MKPPNSRYTVAVDFDGVLHRYDSPWVNAHTIPDKPVVGAMEWLFSTVQRFTVVTYSTRCRTWRGRRAVRRWLHFHAGNLWYESPGSCGVEDVTLSYTKPPALIYLDDRAMRFDGIHWPTPREIHAARPWNKSPAQPAGGEAV